VERDKFTFTLNTYITALDAGCLDCYQSRSSVLLVWLFQKTRVSTETSVLMLLYLPQIHWVHLRRTLVKAPKQREHWV